MPVTDKANELFRELTRGRGNAVIASADLMKELVEHCEPTPAEFQSLTRMNFIISPQVLYYAVWGRKQSVGISVGEEFAPPQAGEPEKPKKAAKTK